MQERSGWDRYRLAARRRKEKKRKGRMRTDARDETAARRFPSRCPAPAASRLRTAALPLGLGLSEASGARRVSPVTPPRSVAVGAGGLGKAALLVSTRCSRLPKDRLGTDVILWHGGVQESSARSCCATSC